MRLATLLALSLAGCAPSALPEVSAPTHVEDPGPPAPAVQARGETGSPVALVVGATRDDVVSVAVEALTALIEGDRLTLERLLAPSLLRASPTLGTTKRSRAAVLAIALNPSRRRAITPGLPLDRLVRLEEIRAVPLESFARADLPPEADPGDVLVSVPLSVEGRTVFRAMLPGWSEAGQLLVTTSDPPIVRGL